MEKEEKAKVILDCDKYQELLERTKWTDIKFHSIALNAYDKAKKEDERLVNELRETIASLKRSNSNLRDNLSYLENVNVSLRAEQIKALRESRLEGYREFAWVNSDKVLGKVMSSLDISLISKKSVREDGLFC